MRPFPPPPHGDGRHLVEPPLPFDMAPRVAAAQADARRMAAVGAATTGRDRRRVEACDAAFGGRRDVLRRLAGEIKQHTLDHLDVYVERWVGHARAHGIDVHLAADAAEADAIVVDLVRRHGVQHVVKSKSMVTEEIGLLGALAAAGVHAIETDLGELVLQLEGDAPSHIVTPMIHLDRAAAARAFQRALGAEYTEDPAALTRIARRWMRGQYRRAELGISGANFLVAETGSLVVCTNEGNADLAVSGPPVHVAVVGIEKLIPRRSDLPVFLQLLARSATGQPLTVYTTEITGPRRAGEPDGPREVHVVLVDNGRSALLAAETRELLRCIRCGACLNACPVYRKVGGGHAYGAVYSGPIGAVLTPHLAGPAAYPDLPRASTLCGACREACPVDIDIPRQLVALRRHHVRTGLVGWRQRLVFRAWTAVLLHPWLYRLAMRVQRAGLRWLGRQPPRGSAAEPLRDRRWVARLPGVLGGWTAVRDLPSPPRHGFRAWWRRHRRRS